MENLTITKEKVITADTIADEFLVELSQKETDRYYKVRIEMIREYIKGLSIQIRNLENKIMNSP